MPTKKKRPPETTPWPNIMTTLPTNDVVLRQKIPISTILICATDEYAIMRLISV